MKLLLTFARFRSEVSTVVDQQLDNIRSSAFDGSHDRRPTVHCDGVHFGAVAQQVLDDPQMTFATGEVKCCPFEIVRCVDIGAAANTKQIPIVLDCLRQMGGKTKSLDHPHSTQSQQ